MIAKKWLLLILQFMFISVGYAESPSAALNTILKNTHSVAANFTEHLLDAHGKSLQKSQGSMQLQSPGMFRWEVTQPNAQLIIANGNRLWVYDKDLEQVTIRKLGTETADSPAFLLSDSHPALENTFTITFVKTSLDKFKLVPKDKSSMYAEIEMTFKNQAIQEMRLQDHLGHTTLIQFQNVKTNTALSPSLFKFMPPKNVDIIDETKKQ